MLVATVNSGGTTVVQVLNMLEDYDERVAILEYDGEETRDTAEQRTWVEIVPDAG